jgi:hypothetical protein
MTASKALFLLAALVFLAALIGVTFGINAMLLGLAIIALGLVVQ